jgi:hypothetical protein
MYELLDDNVEARLSRIESEFYKNVLFLEFVVIDLLLLLKIIGIFD